MKKLLSVYLIIIMMILTLTGCGNSMTGTWELKSVEYDGSTYTIDELEAMGDDSMSDSFIILKDGGQAMVSDHASKMDVTWSQENNVVTIGEQECELVDGKLVLDTGYAKLYFEKKTGSKTSEKQNEEKDQTSVVIKESPDKYTWYIRNYVGKNCASIGYTSLGGDRMDRYGDGYVKLIFVTTDGTYVDYENEDELKQYVVTGQNLAPNTEMKYVFEVDEGGEENSWVDSQSYDEVVLSVRKLDSDDDGKVSLTSISPSSDRYTYYIRDYVNRNLAYCGYTALSGNRMDAYGDGYVRLVLVADDGSYIDPEDEETLKQYVVTGQNIAPDTQLKLVYDIDSEGNEYDNLVSSMNIEEIELNVTRIIE